MCKSYHCCSHVLKYNSINLLLRLFVSFYVIVACPVITNDLRRANNMTVYYHILSCLSYTYINLTARFIEMQILQNDNVTFFSHTGLTVKRRDFKENYRGSVSCVVSD